MKLVLKNNTYVHPLTGEIYEDVYVVDGWLKDDPMNKVFSFSLKILHPTTKKEIQWIEDELTTIETPIVELLGETVIKFDKGVPSYVSIVNEDGSTRKADLFAYLKKGGKLNGNEVIEVGKSSYKDAIQYLLKDNIGDRLEINPNLDPLRKKLAQAFILEKAIPNGEPLGHQFKFPES